MGYFKNICKDNPEIGLGLKYVILGKVFNLQIQDTGGEVTSSRINFFCSNVSSTGKDQGRKAIEIAIDKINERNFLKKNIKFDKSVDVNDASLVGTRKIVKKESVPVFGKFNNYDIMCFPECSTLFVKSEYKSTMIQTIQGALDQPGYVSKSLANTEIKYPTDTAIIMMSIPFKVMTSYLIDTGFFQRFLLFIGEKDFIDIENTSSDLAIEMIRGNVSDIPNKELSDFIDKVEVAYKQHPTKITKFSIDCIKKIKEYENMFVIYRDTNFKSNNDKTMFATFQPRMVKMLIRMAAINSVYKLHKEVLPEDFNEPLKIIKWNIESVIKIIKMKTGIKHKKVIDMDRVESIIREHKGNATDAYHKICKIERVNLTKATELYRQVINNDQ